MDKNKFNSYDLLDLGDSIIKRYAKHKVKIDLIHRESKEDRHIYEVNLKGSTREIHVRARASDVQLSLKLPMLQVVKLGLMLYLVVSPKEPDYDRLPKILRGKFYQRVSERQWLPYVAGHNSFGELVCLDADDFPHALLGGSTNSGKSVALQVLILSIAYSSSADDVNFILIDLGATSLRPFEGLPHLSCPVIRDRDVALHALEALTAEMKRRIKLEYEAQENYDKLPRLVLVIDEFPALFMGAEKTEVKQMTAMLSDLLRRGRHAKIHLVLAAQNPTIRNMKVDLSNITARAAFKCAKRNFSETILGEGGAENLSGSGDMLITAPGIDGVQRIQGIYIKPEEVSEVVRQIRDNPLFSGEQGQKFTIPDSDLLSPPDTLESQLTCAVVRRGPSKADQLLADVIMWALEQDSISINSVMGHYKIGWNKASGLVKRLEELGIVSRPEGKVPREVVPDYPEDIPEELISFLQNAGHSQDAVIEAFCKRPEK